MFSNSPGQQYRKYTRGPVRIRMGYIRRNAHIRTSHRTKVTLRETHIPSSLLHTLAVGNHNNKHKHTHLCFPTFFTSENRTVQPKACDPDIGTEPEQTWPPQTNANAHACLRMVLNGQFSGYLCRRVAGGLSGEDLVQLLRAKVTPHDERTPQDKHYQNNNSFKRTNAEPTQDT